MNELLIGANAPYTDRPWPEETWALLRLLRPRELRVTAFAAPDDLVRLRAECPGIVLHVRPRTGPSHLGHWPEDPLGYRSWETEPSLRECLALALELGFEVRLEAGNEPDIELAREPVDDPGHVEEAIAGYVAYYHRLVDQVRAEFGARVDVAVAALSQGSPGRFERWRQALLVSGCYERADYLAEHLYSDGRPLDDPDWLGRWRAWSALGKPLDVTECNDNGALFAASPEERAEHFAEMLRALRAGGAVRSVSLFALPGSPDDAGKPAWWFLTRPIVEAAAALGAGAQQPAPVQEEPSVNPWQFFTSSQIAALAQVPIEHVESHWPEVAEELAARGIYEREVCAGVVGTMAIETASTFLPVEEAFWLKGPDGEATPEWLAAVARYDGFYGRGDVQLTWESNYRAAGEAIGVDLVANPSLALDRRVSAKVIAWWFDTKGVPSKDGTRFYRLAELCRERDWYWTRVAVQGGTAHLDRLIRVANGLLAIGDVPGSGVPTPPPGPAPLDIVTDRVLPDVPDELVRQRNDWTCAVRSTYAALWEMAELGLAPKVTYGDGGPRDVYEWMVPEIDSSDVGLHYADGHELEALLREKGYTTGRTVGATLAEVQAKAGLVPVLLGFRRWGPAGHWVYCRGVEPDGTLILENPAGTYMGLGDRLRDSFERIGPCTMIWIELVPVAGEEELMDVTALRARIAELEGINAELGRQVADKDRRLMSVVEGFAVAADDLAPKLIGLGRKADRARVVAEIQQLRRERTA